MRIGQDCNGKVGKGFLDSMSAMPVTQHLFQDWKAKQRPNNKKMPLLIYLFMYLLSDVRSNCKLFLRLFKINLKLLQVFLGVKILFPITFRKVLLKSLQTTAVDHKAFGLQVCTFWFTTCQDLLDTKRSKVSYIRRVRANWKRQTEII